MLRQIYDFYYGKRKSCKEPIACINIVELCLETAKKFTGFIIYKIVTFFKTARVGGFC